MDIDIALAASGNIFRYYTQILIASILLNASKKDKYTFHIISDRLTERNKKNYLKLGKIKACNFKFIEIHEEAFENKLTSQATFYRLKLPSLIKDTDKVLYLDSDILSMLDIAELYKYDVNDYYFAAVEDILGEYWAETIGLNYEDGDIYFNAGVLLVNLKKLRKDKIEKKCMKLLEENPTIPFFDQGILNTICKGKILSLPIKYNFMPFHTKGRKNGDQYMFHYKNRFFEYEDAFKKPAILHLQYKPLSNPKYLFADKWFAVKKLVDELNNLD